MIESSTRRIISSVIFSLIGFIFAILLLKMFSISPNSREMAVIFLMGIAAFICNKYVKIKPSFFIIISFGISVLIAAISEAIIF